MEQPLFTANTTVAEVLEHWPQTALVFLRHQMACVGCVMASFDTLEEVAMVYGLSLGLFLNELKQAIQDGGKK